MNRTIAAVTTTTEVYPGYLNVSADDAGAIVITARGDPTMVDGVRICGQTCQPGGEHCNNYCNHDTSKPMPDAPEDHTFARCGDTVMVRLTPAEWQSITGAAKGA